MNNQVPKKPTKNVFNRLLVPVRLEMERIKTDKNNARSPSANRDNILKAKKINDENFNMKMKKNFTEKHQVDNT